MEYTLHILKTWPVYFTDVESGLKNFELRKHDRDFSVNDTLLLKEFDPLTEEYTGKSCMKKITYILNGGSFGLEIGFSILGLTNIE